MSKLTSDLFRKYVAGEKTLLPIEKIKINDIRNILHSFNYMARENNAQEIDLSELRNLKKGEAYSYAEILIGKMKEAREQAISDYYEDSIKTVTKALTNPEEGKSKVENILEEDINKDFIDKSADIFEALAEKLDIRDDEGNLIYNFDLESVTKDSAGARAYIFQHSTKKFSNETADEIAQYIVDQFGKLRETSTTQDAKDKPKPVSVKTQANAAMRRSNYKL